MKFIVVLFDAMRNVDMCRVIDAQSLDAAEDTAAQWFRGLISDGVCKMYDRYDRPDMKIYEVNAEQSFDALTVYEKYIEEQHKRSKKYQEERDKNEYERLKAKFEK